MLSTPLQNSINQLLEPYILRWIAETDTKTLGWVRSAINVDEVSPPSFLAVEILM